MIKFFFPLVLLLSLPALVFSKEKKNEDAAHIIIIEPDIKDKKIKRELEKRTRPPKREFYLDGGLNYLFYQKMSILYQEWKWYDDTVPNRISVFDTRVIMALRANGGEYSLTSGYNFSRLLGFGVNISPVLFPFVERNQYDVYPLFRIDMFPYVMFSFDISSFITIAFGIGPHVAYYHYEQIADNPNAYNVGRMRIETKVWTFGAEAMPQIRFALDNHAYIGIRAQIIFDPVSLTPEVERHGNLPQPSGVENSYQYYFFGNLAFKAGIYAGVSFRKATTYNAARRTGEPPAEARL